MIGECVVAMRSRLARLRGTSLLRTANLLGLLFVTAAFWIFFSVLATGFTSEFNVFFLLRSAAIAVTIGFAQMTVLSIGDMNLSVGAIGGAVGMFAGWLMQSLGVPPLLAVPIAVALGAILGFGNAAFVVWTHLNSFIVTLATASLITGAMLVITHARPFSNLPDSFIGFAQGEVAGLPLSPIVLLVLAAALALGALYSSTSLGREMLAIGANRKAARMSGLPVARIVFLAHGLSGMLAALAGVMSIAANNTASPAVGSDWVLSSFVAPAIGGTLLSGGLVSPLGTVIGGLLVATISSGLLLMSISNFWLNVFLGAVLLLAVGLDKVTRTVGGAA